MKNKITILNAGAKVLTKTFTLANGQLTKSNYDLAATFSAEEAEVENIADLYELLEMLSKEKSCCVIRGKLKKTANPARVNRRKYDRENTECSFEMNKKGANWICCDFDNIPVPTTIEKTLDSYLDYLVSLLPDYMQDVTYVYQWSGSAGIDNWKTLRCHLWFWIEEARTDDELVAWAKEVDVFDDAPFRTVQPNYTADPIFVGMDDPLKDQRLGIKLKSKDSAFVPKVEISRQQDFSNYEPKTDQIYRGSDLSTSFDKRLSAIGPRYHLPIVQAVASWITSTSSPSDIGALKRRLKQRILEAPGEGTLGKKYYLDDAYLDHIIRGCHFAPKADAPNRLPETRQEYIRYRLSKGKQV